MSKRMRVRTSEKLTAPPDHTHRWTVAVRSAASAPLSAAVAEDPGARDDQSVSIGARLRDSGQDLHRAVGGKDDLSYFIKRVQFRLHDTYAQPTRKTGWGEFEIQIKIFFVPEAGEKPLTVLHHLKLHPWPTGPPVAEAPVAGTPTHVADVAAAAPAAAPTAPPPPVVHSWQYEEIVFPEPLEAFYDILIAHPPTPWPATSAQAVTDPQVLSERQHLVHTPTGQVLEALSLEAQRNEADRIDLARANAVKQLDADRTKLIATEKLLQEARAQLAQLEPVATGPSTSA
ncbi:NuA4 histone H4 acetyltransferase complex and the SWR1 complex subunit [Malassezia equina]|uniref:Protein AF-9 homolog n=1 Tax=Malassezia equina TaxID=1381935 RepID=A0AAF0EC62_9BASI|nr:NuA4 histone H4 acetyltransferase complex and the SWR1 complex subunit [Malassezia equina]